MDVQNAIFLQQMLVCIPVQPPRDFTILRSGGPRAKSGVRKFPYVFPGKDERELQAHD